MVTIVHLQVWSGRPRPLPLTLPLISLPGPSQILSFRPEPERTRRRSGGTCCSPAAPKPHIATPASAVSGAKRRPCGTDTPVRCRAVVYKYLYVASGNQRPPRASAACDKLSPAPTSGTTCPTNAKPHPPNLLIPKHNHLPTLALALHFQPRNRSRSAPEEI
jgi:hypothetical protein